MGFAMAQISWRRTDQFCDFMRMLEFRAIYLNNRSGIAEQNLRRCFHDARLARAGGPEKEQIAYWPSWRVQPGAKYLIQVHQRLYSLFLTDDFRPQGAFKVTRVVAADARIELLPNRWFHKSSPADAAFRK